MSSLCFFTKASRFQEYKITGIVDRPVDDHISLCLVREGDGSGVEIPAALPRTIMTVNTLNLGDVISARLSLSAEVVSRDCARQSFEIEAFQKREGDVVVPFRFGI